MCGRHADVLALVIIFHLELSDNYDTDPRTEMFSGLGPARITNRGVVVIVIYLCVCSICAGMWGMAKYCEYCTHKKAQRQLLSTRQLQRQMTARRTLETPSSASVEAGLKNRGADVASHAAVDVGAEHESGPSEAGPCELASPPRAHSRARSKWEL